MVLWIIGGNQFQTIYVKVETITVVRTKWILFSPLRWEWHINISYDIQFHSWFGSVSAYIWESSTFLFFIFFFIFLYLHVVIFSSLMTLWCIFPSIELCKYCNDLELFLLFFVLFKVKRIGLLVFFKMFAREPHPICFTVMLLLWSINSWRWFCQSAITFARMFVSNLDESPSSPFLLIYYQTPCVCQKKDTWYALGNPVSWIFLKMIMRMLKSHAVDL